MLLSGYEVHQEAIRSHNQDYELIFTAKDIIGEAKVDGHSEQMAKRN